MTVSGAALSGRFAARRFSRMRVLALAACTALVVLVPAGGAQAAKAPKSKCTSKHKILRVGTFEGKQGQCATIQEAVAHVPEGGWVLIAPGDYKQSASEHMTGAQGDDRAGADIVVTTPNIHIRGMNRNTVMLDGTKPGYSECSSEAAAQYLGTPEGEGFSGNNGIVVYKAPGVRLQNFSACNFLDGNFGGGNEIWFDGQQSTGTQQIGEWHGEYLSATSTYWGGVDAPNATYGVYASNTFGPGLFENTYASNMSDSGVYIGACPDCKTTINHSQYEGNDLGYSGSNSGGHLVIENTEFNNNEEGVATTSQNNDDAPSPQDGECPGGAENPSPPAGAQRKNICWVLENSKIVENNNGGAPTSDGAPGLLGTGMTDAGGRNDLIANNTFAGNKAWGILVLTYPGIEEEPPSQVLEAFPEDNCRGGIKAELEPGHEECVYEPWANEVEGNAFTENGGYKNPSNGDIGEVSNAEPKQLIDCWHNNTGELAGEPTSEPAAIQTTHGTCSSPDTGGEPASSVLGTQATCDSRLVTECPSVPGEEYPRTAVKLLSVERMSERSPTMQNACAYVPRNPWCPKNKGKYPPEP